jgi:hypothetical protein
MADIDQTKCTGEKTLALTNEPVFQTRLVARHSDYDSLDVTG